MRLRQLLIAGLAALGPAVVHAQTPEALGWLRKMHDATHKLSYSGTFVYRTAHHEQGLSRIPDYEIRDRCLYRTGWHERGARTNPDYEIE